MESWQICCLCFVSYPQLYHMPCIVDPAWSRSRDLYHVTIQPHITWILLYVLKHSGMEDIQIVQVSIAEAKTGGRNGTGDDPIFLARSMGRNAFELAS